MDGTDGFHGVCLNESDMRDGVGGSSGNYLPCCYLDFVST